MEYITLNTGYKMPILGFGVYQIPQRDTERAVRDAIDAGYRHIDTAQLYRNEVGVGKAISKAEFPREDFFITTKLFTSGYQSTKKQIDQALKYLQTDYIDLMLIHWVIRDYHGTYQALEEAFHEGKLRSIGLSNFNQNQVQDILDHFEVKPSVLQNEMHVFYQRTPLRQFSKDKNIQFESWAPFGEGMNNTFTNDVLRTIAKKYDKTVAQIILRFITQEGVVAIPKSVKKERMMENFDIFNFKLDEWAMDTIRGLNEERSLFGWP
ncbi:aldo/keto reductase [Tetragenococcus muriaticus]|uniref:aldo/keto reductase n=1 Tax=Tetragenococcus muriaticus TaxID=64642 RepID=UPI00040C42B0|nr:aldo/keto reductase [Tetragenococcus muriaticus]GMA47574.1 2,5-diketo-D-gluconic acid reductase [Tetragenococcus muriaticus]